MAIWGKLAGAAAGLVIGGPIGAMLGGIAGHALDQWRGEKRPLLAPGGAAAGIGGPWGSDPVETRQIAFATALVVLAAKLAKADGVVTQDEIRAFKEIFDVSDEEVGSVARLYDEARSSAEGFEPYARQIALLFRGQPAVLEELLDGLFQLAAADGVLHPAELAFIGRVAQIMGFGERDFETIRVRYVAAFRPRREAPADPYAVLGIARGATDVEIKTTWKKLVREHHPDRLTAKGMPEEMVAQANRKLGAINAAYDTVAKERGLR